MSTATTGQHSAVIGSIHVVNLANSATLVGALAYAICAVAAALAPGLYMAFFQSWFHGISLTSLQAGAPPLGIGLFLTGLVSFGATVWVATAATAAVYNRMARQ